MTRPRDRRQALRRQQPNFLAATVAASIGLASQVAAAQQRPLDQSQDKAQDKWQEVAVSWGAPDKPRQTVTDSEAEGSAAGSSAAPGSADTSSAPSGENLPNLPPESQVSISDTREDPEKKYYFVGLRYRGTVIPQFLMNLFVNDGATVYSNSIGVELDIRHGGSSLIPWIMYTDFNTGDMLFLEKGKDDTYAANYSDVNSSLKAIFLGVDELWSANLVPTKLDFEFGFGVGIGAVWGDLVNNWVFEDPNGALHATNGRSYSRCVSQTSGGPLGSAGDVGCDPYTHSTHFPAKVGGYIEPNWFNGGPVPVVFPHISVPQIGLRYKPIKQFQARLGLGFGLTGFWFGLGIDYGLEQMPAPAERKAGLQTRLRDTL
jgi:hypothetical protein